MSSFLRPPYVLGIEYLAPRCGNSLFLGSDTASYLCSSAKAFEFFMIFEISFEYYVPSFRNVTPSFLNVLSLAAKEFRHIRFNIKTRRTMQDPLLDSFNDTTVGCDDVKSDLGENILHRKIKRDTTHTLSLTSRLKLLIFPLSDAMEIADSFMGRSILRYPSRSPLWKSRQTLQVRSSVPIYVTYVHPSRSTRFLS